MYLAVRWAFYCFFLSRFHRTNLLGPLRTFPCSGERMMRALELLCSCTWKLCLFSSPWNVQTCFYFFSFFFCAGAESNFLRFFPSFLSEESEVICKLCPFNPHRPVQLFPLKILKLWVERTSAHVLESERRWLFEEWFNFCKVACNLCNV